MRARVTSRHLYPSLETTTSGYQKAIHYLETGHLAGLSAWPRSRRCVVLATCTGFCRVSSLLTPLLSGNSSLATSPVIV